MNLVPIAYKQYAIKQKNKKIVLGILLAMSLVSLMMSLSITFKREQMIHRLQALDKLFRQENYTSMTEMEENIMEQEEYLKHLEAIDINFKNEKMHTLRHLEYLKLAHTNALHIQGYDLNQENNTLEIEGYTSYRESLLEYIERIKEITHFKEITFDTVSSDQKEALRFSIWIEMDEGE